MDLTGFDMDLTCFETTTVHMTVIEYRDKLGGQLCAMQNRATREALTLSNLLTAAVLIVY